MKNKLYALMLLMTCLFTSCLTAGLENLPEFEEANITGVQKIEYRYISDQLSPTDNKPIVKYVDLSRQTNIDTKTNTVSISVTVPVANPSSFPEEERDKCSASNIAVMVSISTAARVFPVGDSPKFGVPGNWSKPNKYIVQAGDGTKKEWIVQVVSFIK